MTPRTPALAVLSWLLLSAPACRQAPEPEPMSAAAQAAADAAADTRELHAAVGAANEVIRNAADCEAAQAAIAAAQRTFAEVEPRLRTAAARGSLAGLRKQVEHVAEACP